jgi:hypothetical protein
LSVIAQAQKRGGLGGFIDVEHAFDPQYARRLGVNLDELLVSQPSSGEEALRIGETLIRSNALDVIVLDSVAALVTKAELEGQIGDATVGAVSAPAKGGCRTLPARPIRKRAVWGLDQGSSASAAPPGVGATRAASRRLASSRKASRVQANLARLAWCRSQRASCARRSSSW